MKPFKFVRFGGLSPVNHKKFYKQDTFHSPPRKKGIYAFIHPYIEPFLVAWKVKFDGENESEDNKIWSDWYKREKRVFTYEGDIWVHFIKEARKLGCANEVKKEWVKVHTNDLKNLLKNVKHCDRVALRNDYMLGSHENIHDPYKRGLGGFMSKDHLEVFIERVK